MNLLNKAKRYVTQKVNHIVFTQKLKLDIKVSQLREDLILKYTLVNTNICKPISSAINIISKIIIKLFKKGLFG